MNANETNSEDMNGRKFMFIRVYLRIPDFLQ